jgi:hypothetical protein
MLERTIVITVIIHLDEVAVVAKALTSGGKRCVQYQPPKHKALTLALK